jgi:hypothetical protein
MSLQNKGFYFTREGDLKSNEGELQVQTSDGVIYTVRFGEVLYGSGMSVTAGTEDADQAAEGSAENRYLFITTMFDQAKFPEPPKPANTDFLGKADSLFTDDDRTQRQLYNEHRMWENRVERGRTKSDQLNTRFADWYYVISSASFDRLNLSRSDLVVKKEAESSS